MEKLFVIYDNNSSFSDFSFEAMDFATDGFALPLSSTTDHLYIGFKKPFSFFYAEMSTPNTNQTIGSFEFFNGATWTPMELVDYTLNFARSGFITWEKPNTWQATNIDGKAGFFIRMRPSSDFSIGTTLKGLGLVFSDDNDLIEEKRDIVSNDNDGESWILKHQASKKDIVQKIRSLGKRKTVDGKTFSDVTEFDLQLDQVRQASKYLTLSKIYLNDLSKDESDHFSTTGQRFFRFFEQIFEQKFLSIDLDDDGLNDEDKAPPVHKFSASIEMR